MKKFRNTQTVSELFFFEEDFSVYQIVEKNYGTKN